MTHIMNSLEFRSYHQGKILINELDECLEIMFVEKGTYEIGYQINNKNRFIKKMGMFSNIGGYQLINSKRFEFIYRTKTVLLGQAIRKEHFLIILSDWPEFSNQIFKKLWQNYSQHVYQPLIKRKNIHIRDFNFRDDYNQGLFLK